MSRSIVTLGWSDIEDGMEEPGNDALARRRSLLRNSAYSTEHPYLYRSKFAQIRCSFDVAKAKQASVIIYVSC